MAEAICSNPNCFYGEIAFISTTFYLVCFQHPLERHFCLLFYSECKNLLWPTISYQELFIFFSFFLFLFKYLPYNESLHHDISCLWVQCGYLSTMWILNDDSLHHGVSFLYYNVDIKGWFNTSWCPFSVTTMWILKDDSIHHDVPFLWLQFYYHDVRFLWQQYGY